MIKLLLKRITLREDYTYGVLWMEDSQGKKHKDFAYVIEDTVRDINADGDLDDEGEGKIYGKTAIPYGEYKGQVRESPKRKKLFDAGRIEASRIFLPYIDNVLNFEGVQIHSGTDENDSLGCLIIGYKTDERKVWESKVAETDLVQLIKQNDPIHWRFKITII